MIGKKQQQEQLGHHHHHNHTPVCPLDVHDEVHLQLLQGREGHLQQHHSQPKRDLNLDLRLVVVPPSPLTQQQQQQQQHKQPPNSLLLQQSRSTPEYLAALTPPGEEALLHWGGDRPLHTIESISVSDPIILVPRCVKITEWPLHVLQGDPTGFDP